MTQPTRRQLANAIRFLAADAVETAKSGHPGMPMGMADIAEVLWNDYLRHNPSNPHWFNRDRFVLSNGHGSMLQYALLHLSGYDLPIEQLKLFRQLGSHTAGHPERHETPGVETTTGPLGQGFANAVGFALAEKLLAQRFNRPELEVVDHRTWVFMGDGCLMEGVSHEAASLAGTWGLHKLVCFWDNNHISIDGNVEGWFTDNTPERFEAYGWNVVRDVDGHDPDSIKAGIEAALSQSDKPTLICSRTTIGFGSPNKAGKESSHGAPLGKDELGYVEPGAVTLRLEADEPTRLLLLGGEPFGEKIVMWWNFIGRDHDEIAAYRREWQDQITADGAVVEDGRSVAHGRFGKVDLDLAPIPAPELPNVRLKQRR